MSCDRSNRRSQSAKGSKRGSVDLHASSSGMYSSGSCSSSNLVAVNARSNMSYSPEHRGYHNLSSSSAGAHNISRLTIPTVTPHGFTNALHIACVNGDKQFIAKLLTGNSSSSYLPGYNKSEKGSASVRASMNSLLVSSVAAFKGSPIDVDSCDNFGRTPLMYCVLGNKLDCAEYLIKSAGANVNACDTSMRTALHWAAHKEHHKILKLLVSKGADCRVKDRDGLTPFHLCMKNRNAKSAALIMKNLNANDLEEQDNYKRTALHLAAMYGSHEQVQMLLQRDANVGIPDADGKTPLHWAISSKHQYSCAIVQALIEHMPSVINWQDHDGRTSLHLAVAEGGYNLVKTLICWDVCKLSCLDNAFRTPLHWAAVMDSPTAPQIVSLLLNKGCDWTCSDSNGATPLHYAAQKNNAETCRAFLQFSDLTDQADIEGRTAFMWAAGAGAAETLDVMLDTSVDISQSDKNGATALHAAAASGNMNCVKLLLGVGCPITADNMKVTPLSRAAELGHVGIAQLLIKHGAKVNQQDREGRFALHWAAYGGSLRMCELLVLQCDVNCSDYHGRTPLQYAAQKGFNNCMNLLIHQGADTDLQDAQGRTALHWSCSLGHLDAVRLLLKSGAFPNHMEFSEERYTPLDYALLNSHHEVAQFMIEYGALSINGVRDIAAAKIQAAFKGARERRSFTERRTLLLKHDKIRKNKSSVSHQSQLQPQVSEQLFTYYEERSAKTVSTMSDEGTLDGNDEPKSTLQVAEILPGDEGTQDAVFLPGVGGSEDPDVIGTSGVVEDIDKNIQVPNDSLEKEDSISEDKRSNVSEVSARSNKSKHSSKVDVSGNAEELVEDAENKDETDGTKEMTEESKAEIMDIMKDAGLPLDNDDELGGSENPNEPIFLPETESGVASVRSENPSVGSSSRKSPNSNRSSGKGQGPADDGKKRDTRSNNSATVAYSKTAFNEASSNPEDSLTGDGKETQEAEEKKESDDLERLSVRSRASAISELENKEQDSVRSKKSNSASEASKSESARGKDSVNGEIEEEKPESARSKGSTITDVKSSRRNSSDRGEISPIANVASEKPHGSKRSSKSSAIKVEEAEYRESLSRATSSASSELEESHRNFTQSTPKLKSESQMSGSVDKSEDRDSITISGSASRAESSLAGMDEASAVRGYISQRDGQGSVMPYDVANDESRKRGSVHFQTPTSSVIQRQLDLSGTNFSLSSFEDCDDYFYDYDCYSPEVVETDECCSSRAASKTEDSIRENEEQQRSVSAQLLLERQEHFRQIRLAEQGRREEIQRRANAARVIQKAWRAYGFKSKKFYKAFKEVLLLRRSIGQEQSLKKEVAALTIQLAWRRYYRRKVLRSSNAYRTLVNKFSTPVRKQKQDFLEARIYTKQQKTEQFYGMRLHRKKRPYYLRNNPYQSALAYNFALRQYRPQTPTYLSLVEPQRQHSAKYYSYNFRS